MAVELGLEAVLRGQAAHEDVVHRSLESLEGTLRGDVHEGLGNAL